MKKAVVVIAVMLLISAGGASAQVYGTCWNPGPIKCRVADPEWSFVPCGSSPIIPDSFSFHVTADNGDETSFRLHATQVPNSQESTVEFAKVWLLRPGNNVVKFRPLSRDPIIQGVTETVVFRYTPPIQQFPAFGIKLISGGEEQ